jgi:hypothetical protein
MGLEGPRESPLLILDQLSDPFDTVTENIILYGR